jgi:hypothetical protein
MAVPNCYEMNLPGCIHRLQSLLNGFNHRGKKLNPSECAIQCSDEQLCGEGVICWSLRLMFPPFNGIDKIGEFGIKPFGRDRRVWRWRTAKNFATRTLIRDRSYCYAIAELFDNSIFDFPTGFTETRHSCPFTHHGAFPGFRRHHR